MLSKSLSCFLRYFSFTLAPSLWRSKRICHNYDDKSTKKVFNHKAFSRQISKKIFGYGKKCVTLPRHSINNKEYGSYNF